MQDSGRLREVDLQFHNALAQASHNTMATLISNSIAALNTNMFWDIIREKPPEELIRINQRAYESHQAIVDAILDRDPERAAQTVGLTVDLFWESIQ